MKLLHLVSTLALAGVTFAAPASKDSKAAVVDKSTSAATEGGSDASVQPAEDYFRYGHEYDHGRHRYGGYGGYGGYGHHWRRDGENDLTERTAASVEADDAALDKRYYGRFHHGGDRYGGDRYRHHYGGYGHHWRRDVDDASLSSEKRSLDVADTDEAPLDKRYYGGYDYDRYRHYDGYGYRHHGYWRRDIEDDTEDLAEPSDVEKRSPDHFRFRHHGGHHRDHHDGHHGHHHKA